MIALAVVVIVSVCAFWCWAVCAVGGWADDDMEAMEAGSWKQ